MARSEFDPSPMEPAHPMVVQLHDDLVAIYTHIREKYQAQIDKAFDRVSRQIGFVVTTTVPVVFKLGGDVSEKGGVIIVDMHPFKGTLFDRELTQALKGFKRDSVAEVSPGNYRVYLFWFEALNLKLRTEWMEPAHWLKRPYFRKAELAERAKDVIWESHEPAHWFDRGIAISSEEAVLISVIDEVYPELRLADRIAASREAGRVRPDIREPAHYRRVEPDRPPEKVPDVLSEIADLLRRYGY